MDKLNLDNKVLTFGKASFNTCNMQGITKVEFMKQYGSALRGQNVNDVWKQVSKHTKVSKSKATKD